VKRNERTALLAAVVAICTAVSGCGPETTRTGGDPATAEPVDAADVRAVPEGGAERQSCVNHAGGFAVEYPAGWHTNDGSVMPACSLFDPQPMEVPPASELPEDIAVAIQVQEVAFETVAGASFGVRIIEREEREVAGRRAVRRLVEQTGEALLDAGIRTYEYVVDWGDGRTLTAHSHDVGEPDFATKRRELDAMMASLRRP